MTDGRIVLSTIATLIQDNFQGALAQALLKYSDAYQYMKSAGKVRTWKGAYYSWPLAAVSSGDADNIQDGGTLPDAKQTGYLEAKLAYSIFIKMIRVGRLTQFASENKDEFYINAVNALTHEIQQQIPQMARTIHKQMVAETDTTFGLSGIGSAIGTMNNTYAGINRTGNPAFVPYVNHNTGTPRTLTEALMLDVYDTLTENRDSDTNVIWAGTTAWNALATLLGIAGATANYHIAQDRQNLAGSAITLNWKGIPVIKMRGMHANHMYFLNFEEGSEGTGIELLKQHEEDFITTPESTNSYDNRISIAGHYMFVVHNPWKQGALKDVQ
jgi:hypothetical protein